VGIEFVVLGLAAVNGFHVQGMTQHKGNVLARADIGNPVPGEDAFHADHQVVPVRCDQRQKACLVGTNITMD
jgi:hypothetical protein